MNTYPSVYNVIASWHAEPVAHCHIPFLLRTKACIMADHWYAMTNIINSMSQNVKLATGKLKEPTLSNPELILSIQSVLNIQFVLSSVSKP